MKRQVEAVERLNLSLELDATLLNKPLHLGKAVAEKIRADQKELGFVVVGEKCRVMLLVGCERARDALAKA